MPSVTPEMFYKIIDIENEGLFNAFDLNKSGRINCLEAIAAICLCAKGSSASKARILFKW